ncbi:MAG TPA: peptidylprolyl isomerase [Pyrinomonadaceae bacterium]|nr:peptidylprolyl isomerase [Pyrinomonadaceae bacterium]
MSNSKRFLRLAGPAFFVFLFITVSASSTHVMAQSRRGITTAASRQIPRQIMVRIVKAEDERRWDNDLRELLTHRNPAVRQRAALAVGRIGNDAAIEALSRVLLDDSDMSVRAMAAFALGEIESELGAPALLESLRGGRAIRPRAIEALGKIAAVLPKEKEARQKELGATILQELSVEHRRRAAPDNLTVLLGITAVLRAKSADAGPVLTEFLSYPNPRIRADAANALARLRFKDGNVRLRKLLRSDPDPIVRANAARVLGATEDRPSFEQLLDAAVQDKDSRVRVSSIRSLAVLKDAPATAPLIRRGATLLLAATRKAQNAPPVSPAEVNELLEIATTLGRLRQDAKDYRTVEWLKELRPVTGIAGEVEIALARIHPSAYLTENVIRAEEAILIDWKSASSIAQAIGEIATVVPDTTSDNRRIRADAQKILLAMLDYRNSSLTRNTLVAVHSEYAIPDVMRAYAAFKPKDLASVLRKHLKEQDVIVRGTAADLLGELPLDSTNTEALGDALKVALADKELNDAALSIVDALAKQKNRNANLAIQSALDSADPLIRRRAVASLKATGAGDFSSRIGIAPPRNTDADYERAIARIGKPSYAMVTTARGTFTIELLPDEAPLNVDNFIQLANRNYFNGIAIHRVVPNFVIQDGDPRGDGNGGPGYQIRCEINEVPYDRGVVGMALSGKDTGGSQWFVTHSPQPHLDGGYTVFGRVVSGMTVVDDTVRGDVIRSIIIRETGQGAIQNRRGNLRPR